MNYQDIVDKDKVIKLGVRKKDEIRECYFCKQDCRKTYYTELIDNKTIWICNECAKKLIKLGEKSVK